MEHTKAASSFVAWLKESGCLALRNLGLRVWIPSLLFFVFTVTILAVIFFCSSSGDCGCWIAFGLGFRVQGREFEACRVYIGVMGFRGWILRYSLSVVTALMTATIAASCTSHFATLY